MNKSLQILYDEHTIIVNMIDVAKQAASLIGKDDEQYEKMIRQLIHFFRTYADDYHHQKEEAILFPEIAKRYEIVADGILKEMYDNHEDFRETIRTIEKSLDEKKFDEAQIHLEKYTEALLYHIAVENEEVFQMAGSLLTEEELENIFYRFQDSDRELGIVTKKNLAELADSLRKNLLYA